tara:strand:+ start:566 stop:916 length:351 start_codon:yes stop_codon:yes gene_type:complete
VEDIVSIINEVGVPVAGLLGLGWLLWQLLSKIMNTLENKVDAIDDSINTKMSNMEQRLMTQLETQHGIIISLIDRVRAVDNQTIRQDVLLKTLLGVPNLIDHEKIAKAERDDQRKD